MTINFKILQDFIFMDKIVHISLKILKFYNLIRIIHMFLPPLYNTSFFFLKDFVQYFFNTQPSTSIKS